MSAPSTGSPVTVTVGALWKFQLQPAPPRPPKLTEVFSVGLVIFSVLRVIIGVAYFGECPQQPMIPNYLLGLVLIPVLMIPFLVLPCENEGAHRPPSGLKACLMCLIGLSLIIWTVAGDVWVFSIYQPNYDRTAADGLYCDKTLYTFALWTAVWESLGVLVCLSKLCRGMMCCVTLSPVPADREFYRNV